MCLADTNEGVPHKKPSVQEVSNAAPHIAFAVNETNRVKDRDPTFCLAGEENYWATIRALANTRQLQLLSCTTKSELHN